MTNSASRKLRKRLHQILFGTILTGMFLVPGIGLVTNSVLAENTNQSVSETSGVTNPIVTPTGSYIGLTGPGGSQSVITSGTISITEADQTNIGGVVVGVMDTTLSTLTVTDEVELTLDGSAAAITVGTTDATTGLARLLVSGPNFSGTSSALIVEEGTLTVNARGILQIGSTETTDNAFATTGSVHILNNGQLVNKNTGTETNTSGGILINEGSSLTIGTSEDDLWQFSDGDIYSGTGLVSNSGSVVINNAEGSDNAIAFEIYEDTATGTLDANGDLIIYSGTKASTTSTVYLNIEGKVTTGNLEIHDDLTIATTGSVETGNLSIFTTGTETERAITNSGTMTLATIEPNDAITLAITNTGTFTSDTLELGTNWSMTNTTTDPTSTAPTTTGTYINDKLTIAGGSLTNTKGIVKINELEISDGSMTLSGGTSTIGSTENETGTTQTGGTVTIEDTDTTDTATPTAIFTDYDMSGGAFTASAGTVSFNTLTQSGGTATFSGAGVTATDVTLSDTSSTTVSNGSFSISGLLTMTGGTLSTSAGTTSIGELDQTAGTIKASGGTTTITSGTLSEAGTIEVTSTGNIGIVELEVDSTSDTPFMTIGGTGNVMVTGELILRNGTISIDATSRSTESFTVGSGGILTGGFTSEGNFDPDTAPAWLDVTQGSVNLTSSSFIGATDLSTLDAGTYKAKLVDFESNANGSLTNESAFAYADSTFFDFENATNNNDYVMTLTVRNFASFAQTPNQQMVGSYIDSLRTSSSMGENLAGIINDNVFYSAATPEEVRNALDQLGGVHMANGLMLAMENPWTHAFDRMTFNHHRNRTAAFSGGRHYPERNNQSGYEGGSFYRGQMSSADQMDQAGMMMNGSESGYQSEYYGDGSQIFDGSLFNPENTSSNSAWGTFFYTDFSSEYDGNSQEYGISRPGAAFGYDIIQNSDTIAGVMFNYSHPRLTAEYQRINMNNFQLGLYGGRHFSNGVQFKMFGNLGSQEYSSKRKVFLPTEEIYMAHYDGVSFALCAQLSREIQLNCYSLIRPLVQVDLQQVWQDGSTEEGSGTAGAALLYNDADWNRTFVRVGFETEVNAEFLMLTGRAMYGCQLNGDSAPSMSARFVDVTDPSRSMSLSGVDLGSSFYNIGMGALGYFDCQRHWSISGTYDLTGSNNSTAHTGTVSITYLF